MTAQHFTDHSDEGGAASPPLTAASPRTENDPFGPDIKPPPLKATPGFNRREKSTWDKMIGDDPERTGIDPDKKKPVTNPTDETKRIRVYLDSIGEFGFKTEHYEMIGFGSYARQIKRDLLGFGDWIGLGKGTVTAYNVTTKGSVARHISKWSSTDTIKVNGRGEPSYRELIYAWLDAGCKVAILSWDHDEKGHWRLSRTDVTREVLEKAIWRKRS